MLKKIHIAYHWVDSIDKKEFKNNLKITQQIITWINKWIINAKNPDIV